ncbi:MAG: ABC transporter permease [Rikenellaceae bacterium]
MGAIDISYTQLGVGFLLLLIPTMILLKYRVRVVKRMYIAVLRMVVQLTLVGLYLDYLFEWNLWWVNTLWLIAMASVATFDMLRTVKLERGRHFFPIIVAMLLSVGFIMSYFLVCVLMIDNLFESQYFITISGILMGNLLMSNVIAINTLFASVRREMTLYNYMLCNGATQGEAAAPFIREALQRAVEPTIASTALIGLVSLPGTLVGQILGGSPPDTAIRYQMMTMVIVLSCNTLSLSMTLPWVLRRSKL